MSQVKNYEFEGDIAVSRNARIGGDAEFRGNTRVKKNLIVEGWLEARNIKGPNKGLFRSEQDLKNRYTSPHDGWWALVGETLPAKLYMAIRGTWHDTNNTTGELTIDFEEYAQSLDALERELKTLGHNYDLTSKEMDELAQHVNNLDSTYQTVSEQVKSSLQQSTEARQAADRALKAADAAAGAAAAAGEAVKALADSKGVPSGIAPLGPDGKVPSAYLPLVSGSAGCDCSGVRVLPFDAVVAPNEVYDGSGVAMVDDGVAEQWFTGDFSAYGTSEEDYNMRISHAGVSVARVDCLFLKLSDEEGHALFAKHSYGTRLSRIGGMAFETVTAEEAKEIVTNTFNK